MTPTEEETRANEATATLGQRVQFYLTYYLVIAWGLLCTLIFLIPAVLMWGNTSVSWVYARTLSWVGLKLMRIRLEISGEEHLADRPAIVVANHQSNYDMILVGQVYPRRTVVIGKQELRKVPLFGTFFAATGNIMINRTDRSNAVAGLDQAVAALRTQRTSIWIFPEGQRSRGAGLGPFKKGAFHMAIAAGVPVIPIVCSSADRVINARRKLAPGGLLRIHILPPVSTKGLASGDVDSLKDKVHAQCVQEWNRLEPQAIPAKTSA